MVISNTYARQIVEMAGLHATVDHNFNCAQEVSINVEATDANAFKGDRIGLQKLLGGARAALGFECDSIIKRFNIIGKVEKKPVYQAYMQVQNNWRLTEKESGQGDLESLVINTSSNQPKAKTFSPRTPSEKVQAWSEYTKGRVFYRSFFRTGSTDGLILEIRPAKHNSWCGATALLDGFIELDPEDSDSAARHVRNFTRSNNCFGNCNEKYIIAALATFCPQARDVIVRIFEYGFPDALRVQQFTYKNGSLYYDAGCGFLCIIQNVQRHGVAPKIKETTQGKTIIRKEIVNLPPLEKMYLPGDTSAYQTTISRQIKLLEQKAEAQFGFILGKSLVEQIGQSYCLRYVSDFIQLRNSDARSSVCNCFNIEMGELLVNGKLLESGQESLFEWRDRSPEEQKKLGMKLVPSSEKIKKISHQTFRSCAQKYSGRESYKTKGNASGRRTY